MALRWHKWHIDTAYTPISTAHRVFIPLVHDGIITNSYKFEQMITSCERGLCMHSWSDTASAAFGDTSPESVVIARAKSGDHEAISWLYERYAPLVRRYVAGRVGDAQLAEDICNDVFVKVLESLGRYEDRGWPFSAWLYRIAYARSMDILRQTRRRPSVPLDEALPGNGEPLDETIMMRMAHHEIQQVMGVLTNDQQVVLRLRFTEDRSLAEVAASLGRTVGSVKALQHRGLARLAEELAGQPGQAFAMR